MGDNVVGLPIGANPFKGPRVPREAGRLGDRLGFAVAAAAASVPA